MYAQYVYHIFFVSYQSIGFRLQVIYRYVIVNYMWDYADMSGR